MYNPLQSIWETPSSLFVSPIGCVAIVSIGEHALFVLLHPHLCYFTYPLCVFESRNQDFLAKTRISFIEIQFSECLRFAITIKYQSIPLNHHESLLRSHKSI